MRVEANPHQWLPGLTIVCCINIIIAESQVEALLQFYRDLLAFFLKLFQGEFQSVNNWSVAPHPPSSRTLLCETFWTVWERSTLMSQAVKQLTRFLVQAAAEDYSQSSDKQKLHLADILLDLLSVLVEFWCQQHYKLNHSLMEKGLKHLAEQFAIISQGKDKKWKLISFSQSKDITAKPCCIIIATFKVI
ncbi:unnamed protein product [Tetraodon nigroviridis]|uniref:(spotted green pufferfish) hypothetical protein n=1 Tax=Tetraodon nigroviridis TaxID=99883 RepID=Q4SG34_TETNG|nr:unnamed protein product [Tetraodon nigroviridis]